MAFEKDQRAQLVTNLILILVCWTSATGLVRALENMSLNRAILAELGVRTPTISNFFYMVGAFLLRHHSIIFFLCTSFLLACGFIYLLLGYRFDFLISSRKSLTASVFVIFISIFLGVIIWLICWWWPLRRALQIGF